MRAGSMWSSAESQIFRNSRRLGAFKVLVQQLVKGMGGAMPIQDFPRPIVEQGLHPLDLGARQPSEPRAFGKELAQQAIGVLVRAPLPGRMRVRKIDAHRRLLREEAMLNDRPRKILNWHSPAHAFHQLLH